MKAIMIDIETMGTKADAAVLAIGARIFTPNGISIGFETFISQREAERIGSVSADTMKFWSKQDPKVYELVFGGVKHPSEAALELSNFIKVNAPETVWAKPPRFDITILEHMYAQVGLDVPWQHRAINCHRTLLSIGKLAGVKLPDISDLAAHNPLDDATAQARQAAAILKALTVQQPKTK